MAANALRVDTAGAISHDTILMTHGAPVRRMCLLFHGLTASPQQFAGFGALLYERGANVFIPRLPHHGHADRMSTALQRLTASELRAFASESLATARELGDRVTVVGFSVGGLLSAWIAQHHAVARSVSVAPFLGIAWLPPSMTAGAAQGLLRSPNRFYWWDPRLRDELGPPHGYPRFATHAIAQAATLASDLLRDARLHPRSTPDVRIAINARETAVSNPSALQLARRWTRRGPPVVVHRFHGLPPSHDIIEPLRSPAIVARVYPELLTLVDA